jgi:hypothetical protein
MRSQISRKRSLRRLKPPEPTPDGMVCDPIRGGFAPMEWIRQQAAWSMWSREDITFRMMDKGNDYDLCARTKAARAATKKSNVYQRQAEDWANPGRVRATPAKPAAAPFSSAAATPPCSELDVRHSDNRISDADLPPARSRLGDYSDAAD